MDGEMFVMDDIHQVEFSVALCEKALPVTSQGLLKPVPVSIAGLDRVELTYALWDNSKEVSGYISNGESPPPPLTKEAVRAIGDGNEWKFYNLHGRVMKCDLSETVVEAKYYDHDNHETAFETVVKMLRGSQ